MAVVFISSVPFGGGERLAQAVARKLGYAFVGRDQIVARANECGIPVGKLELAMVKRPSARERLAHLKQRYVAVSACTICEKAVEDDVVYYGRGGQFVLPGISHVLRVRVIPERGRRLEDVMQRAKLSREKAEAFLEDVDADIRAWVQFVHGAHMDDLNRYDVVLNLENMSIENAASALCAVAELPDFKATPSSQKAIEARLLQARARMSLALDERTAEADLTVRANAGVVTVTYMPRDAELAPIIPEVLQGLRGCRQIRCTVASTNILWIEEEFRPDAPEIAHVSELARRWGAAVELMRYVPPGREAQVAATAPERAPLRRGDSTGGVEDDVVERLTTSDRSFRDTVEVLVRDGRSGGARTVTGSADELLAAVSADVSYSLVTVGTLFLHKPTAVRTRTTRELAASIARRIRAPVISTHELERRLHLGGAEVARAVLAALAVVALYVVLFRYQVHLGDLLAGPSHRQRPWIAPILVALVAPLVAWLYGMVSASILKLIRLE
jgi:cytidylate kinase